MPDNPETHDEIDWLELPASERVEPTKALYKALRAVSDITARDIDLLMDDAYGEPNTTSPHYASNFRRGKIAAGKAIMIHRWLEQNHFDIARTAAPELFKLNPKSAWQKFVEENAKAEGLRMVPLKREMGILSRAKNAPKMTTSLKLGQLFCFELNSPIDGVVIAFEGFKGSSHPLPLGADERQLRVMAKKGVQILPRDARGQPIELEERQDTGPHDYVFVVAPDRSFPSTIREIAKMKSDQSELLVFKMTVRFVT